VTRSTGNAHGSKWIRPTTRHRIYLRDGGRCVWCGSAASVASPLTLDHVVPRRRGGTNAPSNLITACGPCNSWRGDRSIPEMARSTVERRLWANLMGETRRAQLAAELTARIHSLRRRMLPPLPPPAAAGAAAGATLPPDA
jgi:hypothetical protein